MRDKKTELLLPVGDMEMCLAAIHSGADAIYVGVPKFNARGRTVDHSIEELKEIINLCHLYGVKVHLAFNVLIFESELLEALNLLKELIALGPDAFIVQDIGLARLIRLLSPTQVIHASTQMTVTSDQGILALDDLHISRFVLGREVSMTEMQKIRAQTDKELEVFVHGALCVAYSGQCFTSEAIGGRSANRGQCAQSCRLEYDLIVDDKKYSTFDRKYLVSPKDLMGIDEIQNLINIGINSFKVEGRLKGPEYVAATGTHYKAAMQSENSGDLEKRKRELSRTYSRGFFTGWLGGVDHQKLVDGSYSSHRGELLGSVFEVSAKSFSLKTQAPVANGDGILIVGENAKEFGSFVYDVKQHRDVITIKLDHQFNYQNLKSGMRVFLNKDQKLVKELSQKWKNKELLKKIPVKIELHAFIGKLPFIKVQDLDGHSVEVLGEEMISKAKDHPATLPQIQEFFSTMGASCFKTQSVAFLTDDKVFLPNQVLKSLKKKVIQLLELERLKIKNVILEELQTISINKKEKESTQALISLLIRSSEQLEEFLQIVEREGQDWSNKIRRVVLDYEFGQDYQKSLLLLKSKNYKAFIATNRILKPGEYHHLNVIGRLSPDGVLVRNLGAWKFLSEKFKDLELIGDYSLNVTNSLTVDYLRQKNLSEICLGLDLNQYQVDDLLLKTGGQDIEIVAHHYMPEFHMEHCVFAAFLSKGSSFKDCGKPCEKHKVSMKDPYGNFHHLSADQECRNTMFNATPQSGLGLIKKWKEKGVATFRIEALRENGVELFKKVKMYQEVLEQKIDAEFASNELGLMEAFGVSSKHWQKKDTYQDRKKNTL